MNGRERNDSGRYTETVTLDGVLGVFDRVRGPVITSSDVADALDCSTEAARQKLRALADRGDVDHRKTGRTTVWWRVHDTPEHDDHREATETSAEPPRDEPTQPPEETPRPQSEQRTEPEGPLADVVDDVAGDTLPGSGAKLEARRDALRAVVAYLREHGTATPADLRRDVYPDHRGGYVDGKDPARSWWKNAMYPALAELAERSDAIEKADTTGEWSYQGTK